ncbi:MAG TPA: hypothetical protein VEJ46_00545 [Candidatus Acidoferrum sp.]|nr:hypothetical protein [Candidatus Acidoferrum sp.]
MAAKIEIKKTGEDVFQVFITDGENTTSHRVTMKTDDYERISGDPAESTELVRRAIELLLAREHPKPIPPECDLTILGQYLAHFARSQKAAT